MKAAIYLRTATTGQDEEQKLRAQHELAEKYCAEQGIAVHGFYCDEGISGLTAFGQRPKGSQLLRDAQAGAFDSVLVHSIDRLGRDAKAVVTLRRKLASLGINVNSLEGATGG